MKILNEIGWARSPLALVGFGFGRFGTCPDCSLNKFKTVVRPFFRWLGWVGWAVCVWTCIAIAEEEEEEDEEEETWPLTNLRSTDGRTDAEVPTCDHGEVS